MKSIYSLSSRVLYFVLFLLACRCDIIAAERPPIIIQSLKNSDSSYVAILEQVDYANGILTSTEDRVRVSKEGDINKGEIVFCEDVMPPLEKPNVQWSGSKLIISFSRDAYVFVRKQEIQGLTVEYLRRSELLGKEPIGPLSLALLDSHRIWTRDDLTAKVWQTCRNAEAALGQEELNRWFKLLDVRRVLLTDDTLNPGIEVRELALMCIFEFTGHSSLLEKAANRDVLYTGMSGRPERFYIKIIEEQNWPELAKSARQMAK
jgi:hypothetical protein